MCSPERDRETRMTTGKAPMPQSKRVVVSVNGICAACWDTAILYRNPLGKAPVCATCLIDRLIHQENSNCNCPDGVVLGSCPTHGFFVP